MGWIARVLDRIDFLLSWWERISTVPWIQWGVATVTTLVFNWWAGFWAGFTQQPAVVHVTVILGAAAFVTLLFTHLPPLLRKITRPRFEVSVPIMISAIHRIEMNVSVVNLSPKARMVLEFAVCLQAEDETQTWFLGPELSGININLGPRNKTEGKIACSLVQSDPTETIPPTPKTFLQVRDRISTRQILLKVPGSYPSRPSWAGELTRPPGHQIAEKS